MSLTGLFKFRMERFVVLRVTREKRKRKKRKKGKEVWERVKRGGRIE